MRQRAGDGPFLDHDLETRRSQQKEKPNKLVEVYARAYHNGKVQHEEEGDAAGVTQEACKGERNI